MEDRNLFKGADLSPDPVFACRGVIEVRRRLHKRIKNGLIPIPCGFKNLIVIIFHIYRYACSPEYQSPSSALIA